MSARRLRRDDRGVSALELAFIAPSLIFLIFFVIQGAFYYYGRSVALQTAREGVSQLRLEQTFDQWQNLHRAVESQVADYAKNVGSGALHNVVVTSHYNFPDRGEVTVTVTGTAVSVIGATFHVTEQATGRIEQFQELP